MASESIQTNSVFLHFFVLLLSVHTFLVVFLYFLYSDPFNATLDSAHVHALPSNHLEVTQLDCATRLSIFSENIYLQNIEALYFLLDRGHCGCK